MDVEIRVPEKHRWIDGDGDRDLSPITFRVINEAHRPEWAQFVSIFWEYWLKVNREDLSGLLEPVDGYQIPRAYGVLLGYKHLGYQFQGAFSPDGEIRGFLVYHKGCDSIVEVRHLYSEPRVERKGLGKGLIDSLGTVTHLLFQTQKANPPERLLNITGNRTKLAENEHRTTWLMRWERKECRPPDTKQSTTSRNAKRRKLEKERATLAFKP